VSRVAILALGNSALRFDPAGYDAVYALPWDAENAPKATHLFEMHPLELLGAPATGIGGSGRSVSYLETLRSHPIGTLFMQQAYPEVPNAHAYPLFDVQKTLGRDYFGSSPAYMLGLAIHLRFERIEMYGVDLDDSIYDHQRPNLEWLIGFAQGQRTEVYVPPASRLMTFRQFDRLGSIEVRYPVRYGYEPMVRRETWENPTIR